MRVEPKTIGIGAVTHHPRLRYPCRLNDKLTLVFKLRWDRRIRMYCSHFLSKTNLTWNAVCLLLCLFACGL